MPLEITRVETGRDLRRFIDLPWRIYNSTDHPQWVPPLRLAVTEALDRKKNPFYKRADRELFLAHRDGRLVGRIAAVENRAHNEFHNDRVGFWGFFEVANDQEAANALFTAAEGWLRERGFDTMRGPMNPSTNHECGLLIDGFEQHPMIMTTWNPRYYAGVVEAAGFSKAKDLVAYFIPLAGPDALPLPERYRAHAERATRERGVRFRDIDLSHFAREVDICWEIYNAAWEKNWGFIPMTREEFVFSAKEMKQMLIPQFSYIAEVDGKPAGVAISLPDYHQTFKAIGTGRLLPTGLFKLLAAKKRLRSGRLMILGVKSAYRSRSIFALFAYEMHRRASAYGMVGGEASWILEDNAAMVQPMEAMGAKVYRTWRIYDRPIPRPGSA